MSAFSLHAPPKERQLAIDEYFVPTAGKPTMMQQGTNRATSQYFQGGSMISAENENILSSVANDFEVDRNPRHQSLPMFLALSERLSQQPTQQQQPQRRSFADEDNDDFQSPSFAQTVPVLKQVFKKEPLRSTKTFGTARKQHPRISKNAAMDLSKTHPGGTRLRNIQFAKSIGRVTDRSIMTESHKFKKESMTSVLVEVIGILISRMTHNNYCWDFSLRDPTIYDFSRKHPTAVSPIFGLSKMKQVGISGHGVLQCRLFDADNSTDQDALERDEILRVVGVVSQCEHEVGSANSNGFQLQCVGIRTATVDEVRLAIEGLHRGLIKKRA